jgi:4-amino-4-deoxy-L-arabinose transferase-like glycosyltransferase
MTSAGSPQERLTLGFWLLLGAALLIRLWGTWYGLPFTYYNDEYHEVMRALQLGTGSFNFGRSGKGGLYLILFLEYGLYFVTLKLAGVVESAQEFGKLFATDPTAFYLIGRVTVAVFGAATVAAVYFLARQAYSTAAGLLAGLFLAFNALHIDLSRLIGLDVLMTLLAMVSLYFGLRMIETQRRRDYLLAALFAALATTTKLPGILLLLPLLVAHTYAVRKTGGTVRSGLASGYLWLAVIVFAGVLMATNPGIVNIAGFMGLFADSGRDALDDDALLMMAEAAGTARPNLYVFYFVAIRESMGWPLFLLSIASLAYACWRRTQADVVLISYALINYVVISATTSEVAYYPRYALPIIVVLLALGARGLADLLMLVPSRRSLVAAATVIFLLATPIADSVAIGRQLTQVDSRTLALRWFESNVPAGTRVLIEGGKVGPVRSTVPLHDTRQAISCRIGYWQLVEPRQSKLLEYRLAAHQGGGYDLELIRVKSLTSVDDYLAMGVQYFVMRPEAFAASRKGGGVGSRFLNELRSDPRIVLVKRFEGVDATRLSPTIEIYRVVESGQ